MNCVFRTNRLHTRVGQVAVGLLVAVVVSGWTSETWANLAQFHVMSAGVNLGQAEARLHLFGPMFGGTVPADQQAAIGTHLANATAHMAAAESLFGEPIRTHRAKNKRLQQVTSQLARYEAVVGNASWVRRENYIQNVYSDYKTGLSVFYRSSDPHPIQVKATCDTYLLIIGYELGKASIASAVADNQRQRFHVDTYQRGAVTSANHAVAGGLRVAIDGPYPDGIFPDPRTRKLCCSIGTKEQWAAFDMLALRTLKNNVAFGAKIDQARNIALGARVPNGVCGDDPCPCACTDYAMPKPQHGFGGTWTSNWGQMVFEVVGARVTGTYTHDKGKIEGVIVGNTLEGTWSEAPSYQPPRDAGRVRLTLSADGKSLSGNWGYGPEGKMTGTWSARRK